METKYIGMLGAFAAVSLVFFAIGASVTPMLIAEPMKTQSTSGWIQGHVTTTVFDENGYITHYAQSDNAVMDDGEDCAIRDLFDDNDGGGSACGTLGGSFDQIAIGDSAAAVAVIQSALQGTESARQQDTACAFTAAAGAGQAGECVLSTQFTGLAVTVEESGVFDAAAVGNMFARQLTGTIVLTAPDTLQVDWTFTIDGTTNP